MKLKLTIAAAGCMLALAPAAFGEMVDLGGGWQATLLDTNVDVVTDYVSIEDDILVIQKFANFIEIDPFTGLPEPVRVAFNQIAPDEMTVSRIAITDELVFNNTGVDWTSYVNALLGPNVMFNQAESASFTIDPFTVRTYNDDSSRVEFSGGLIAAGDHWTPGLEKGALVIDIDLSGDDAVKFVLKEFAVPAPGAVALLGLAGLARTRRRHA